VKLDGERVRDRRERLTIPIREACERSGVALNTWVRAEHGEEIRLSSARRIAEVLGVEPGYLMGEPEAPKVTASPTPEPGSEQPEEGRRELSSAADKFFSDTTRGTPPIDFDDLVKLRDRVQRLGDTHRTLREQHEKSDPLSVSDWAYDLEALTEKLLRDGVEAALEYGGLAPVKHGGVADVKEDWKAEQLRLKEAFDTLVNLQKQADHLASQKRAAAGYSEATMSRAAEAVLDREAQRQKETR
jgi:transcriptional regulator with XRE-family HTH domain